MVDFSGHLKKLAIKAYTEANYSGSPVAEFSAYFNPEEYAQVYEIEYDDKTADGATGSPMVFKGIKPKEYRLKLVIDGTGVSGRKIDVPAKITEFYTAIGYDGNKHRTRFLWLLWGQLSSKCVLLKAEISYKIFKPDGTPLRAVIDASFKENIDDVTRALKENKRSPDLTHLRVVKAGDTLPLLANEIYGDPSHYLEVARFNRLNNYRRLIPGQRIVFPPLDK